MQHGRDKPQRILLAEDDEDDIFLFTEALSDSGNQLELLIAKDGIELIDVINEAGRIDLVFLDINMPRKNGLECLTELNGHPQQYNIPIICLSTSTSIEIIEQAKSLGAIGYITKPTTFTGYQQMMADVLSKNWKTRSKSDFYRYFQK